MNNTKQGRGHTPGPWHVGEEIHEFQDGTCWFSPVWSDNGPENGKIAAEAAAPTREMARANAALIAAAPELLEAAKRVIFPDGGRDYTDGKEALAQAIAKASGGPR